MDRLSALRRAEPLAPEQSLLAEAGEELWHADKQAEQNSASSLLKQVRLSECTYLHVHAELNAPVRATATGSDCWSRKEVYFKFDLFKCLLTHTVTIRETETRKQLYNKLHFNFKSITSPVDPLALMSLNANRKTRRRDKMLQTTREKAVVQNPTAKEDVFCVTAAEI